MKYKTQIWQLTTYIKLVLAFNNLGFLLIGDRPIKCIMLYNALNENLEYSTIYKTKVNHTKSSWKLKKEEEIFTGILKYAQIRRIL